MFSLKPIGFTPAQSRRGFSAVPSVSVVMGGKKGLSGFSEGAAQNSAQGGYGLSNTVPLSQYEN